MSLIYLRIKTSVMISMYKRIVNSSERLFSWDRTAAVQVRQRLGASCVDLKHPKARRQEQKTGRTLEPGIGAPKSLNTY